MGAVEGDAGQVMEALESFLAKAREPLADGLGGGGKEPGSGFDAVGHGMVDDSDSQIVLVDFGIHPYDLLPIGKRFHFGLLSEPGPFREEAYFILKVYVVDGWVFDDALAGAFPPAPASAS